MKKWLALAAVLILSSPLSAQEMGAASYQSSAVAARSRWLVPTLALGAVALTVTLIITLGHHHGHGHGGGSSNLGNAH